MSENTIKANQNITDPHDHKQLKINQLKYQESSMNKNFSHVWMVFAKICGGQIRKIDFRLQNATNREL